MFGSTNHRARNFCITDTYTYKRAFKIRYDQNKLKNTNVKINTFEQARQIKAKQPIKNLDCC